MGDTPDINYLSHGLARVSITTVNKQNLFSEAIQKLGAGYQEADLILLNLRSWAPDVAARFSRRTPDVIVETPFRLIYTAPFSFSPQDSSFVKNYLAVSYSWHNSEWPGTPSCVPEPNGVWPIGQRFAEGILAERNDEKEGIWMDQICINQHNDAEKQRAIACMDVIYKSCRKLVVLLEDVELTDEEAAVCKKYDSYESPYILSQRHPDKMEIPPLKSLSDKVSAARWWQRAWCFHEFVVGEPWSERRHQRAHNTVFIVGLDQGRTVTVGWMALHTILVMVTTQLGHKTPQSKHINPILSGFSNRTSPLLDDCDPPVQKSKSSFMARFNTVSQTGCSMPGDRLSVFINLTGVGLAYFREQEPTVDEVYYLATLLSLAAGEKISLSFANAEPLIMVNDKQSWLMRPITEADTTLGKFRLGGVKGIRRVSVEKVDVDMVILNLPFTGCTEEEIQATHDIFPELIRSTQPPLKHNLIKLPAFRADADMERPRRQFLAAVVAGGSRLAHRLWLQLDTQVVKWAYNTGIFSDFTPNKNLEPTAARFLNALDRRNEAGYVENVALSDKDALLFITWITDPRSIYWISSLVARIQCTEDGQCALLTGFSLTNHFAARGSDIGMKVAIPVDLLEEDCAWTRAWILAPFDSKKKDAGWIIVAKALLLGEPGLREEISKSRDSEHLDSTVALLKGQTIVGSI